MEVAGGNHHILVGEHGGIVGNGIYFSLKHSCHVIDGILGGSMHLRDAAEGVRILHMHLRACNQLASCKQRTESLAGLDLTLMRADGLDLGHERIDTAIEGVERQRTDFIGPAA